MQDRPALRETANSPRDSPRVPLGATYDYGTSLSSGLLTTTGHQPALRNPLCHKFGTIVLAHHHGQAKIRGQLRSHHALARGMSNHVKAREGAPSPPVPSRKVVAASDAPRASQIIVSVPTCPIREGRLGSTDLMVLTSGEEDKLSERKNKKSLRAATLKKLMPQTPGYCHKKRHSRVPYRQRGHSKAMTPHFPPHFQAINLTQSFVRSGRNTYDSVTSVCLICAPQ
ncbi:hypothetical protein E2C01_040715 [Portunus trituberculatus]|uniref:Uncharacterized protein n=1 Tax=Portunus trituberculatus TaxID=210409 RepID=A0A5B7FI50_PORTR|nr:hypothetical protein [Portunus trituberculatus]